MKPPTLKLAWIFYPHSTISTCTVSYYVLLVPTHSTEIQKTDALKIKFTSSALQQVRSQDWAWNSGRKNKKWPVKQTSRACHQTFLHLLSYMHCTCKFKTNLEQKTNISISIKVEKPEKPWAKFDRPSGTHVHAQRENTMKNTIHTHVLYPTGLL